ncbi:MAG TPA: hypothetical protein VNK04_26770 [Gemmataceae bacterium]|nr:hypothetical protein [Gemmataceae bacterium]
MYRQAVLAEMWRLASLLDRNPHSHTRGSFSRIHWAWKFGDFPFPRLQEAVYALARLHDLPGDDNPFYHSEAVARWLGWGFDYWATLQHRNGSFDEAYPFEQCLAATAFTSFYLGSAYLLWKDRLGARRRARLERAFARAGDWLCGNDETHGLLSNHLAAAVAALEVLARVCRREEFSWRARFFLARILRHQSAEGWFREYDGADIGYGTHGFFYLAVYWKLTGCPETLDALRRCARFLAYFVHPDGTIGGEYGSRNTEFYYPAGFELLAGHCPSSAAIAAHLRESIRQRRVCGVWGVDLFNFLPMLNNLFFALDAEGPLEAPPLPWQLPPFQRYFEECGLWVVNEERYYAVVGLSKGGTVSVFDKRRRCLAGRHGGLVCRRGKTAYTSQDYTLAPEVAWSSDRPEASLTVPWKILKVPVFSPPLFLAFRLFTLTLGRFPAVSRWVKDLLVAVLIRRKSRPAITHRRTLRAGPTSIVIEDVLTLPGGVEWVEAVEQFTAIHMGSSMYCDIRSVGPGTGVVPFAGKDELRLRGVVGIDGTTWEEQNRPARAAAA